MHTVVDCSVSMAWVLPDEASPQNGALLERVRGGGGGAPALWRTETWNALITAKRLGRLTAAGVEDALATIGGLNIALDDSPRRADVFRLAEAHGLTAYDSLYLELALRTGSKLATLDGKLINAAHAAGAEIA